MHPCVYAKTTPDKAAYIMAATGEIITYRQLDERSNQVAHYMRSMGLQTGDHIALFMENHARFFEICWGAQRAGLYFTAISSRLTALCTPISTFALKRAVPPGDSDPQASATSSSPSTDWLRSYLASKI